MAASTTSTGRCLWGSPFEHGGKDQVKTGAKEFGALKDLMASLDWTFDHTEKDIKDSLAYIRWGQCICLILPCTTLDLF